MRIGKILAALGLILLFLGLTLNYAPWLINWFGKLPGDIRIEDDKKLVFIPIVSMLVISLVLSVLLSLFIRK
jgi:hypothetical protein